MATNKLETAKQLVKEGKMSQEALEILFPGFKESEDERIMKNIITFLDELFSLGKNTNFDKWSKSDCAEWIAWLKKQCEQEQPTKYTLEQAARIFLDALSDTPYNNKPVTDAQVITRELLKFLSDARSYNPDALNEQNPAWSEEDEDMEDNIFKAIQHLLKQNDSWGFLEECLDWLKSLKNRINQGVIES